MNIEGQNETPAGSDPNDKAGRILYDISKAAHEYVKSITTYLTSLRTADPKTLSLSPQETPKREPTSFAEPKHVEIYSRRLLVASDESEIRGESQFAKDYARIIHSPSFRRLQGKTQLIPAGENEFFRTRLTHSLEVAEIATRIAARFNASHAFFSKYPIDLNLVACSALLHDIGHPPFGHSGEETLNECMKQFGGFEGNAQTLRMVTKLENRLGRGGSVIVASSTEPRGLNLTIGTLASILKYDSKSEGPKCKGDKIVVNKGYYPTEADTVTRMREQLGLAESPQPLCTLECQIMDIADDIAYSAYDLEDTLEAGIITPFDMMSIDDKTLDMITVDVNSRIAKRLPGTEVTPQMILFHLANVFGTLLMDGETENPYRFDQRPDRLAFVGRTYAESLQHAKNPLVRRQYLETLIEQNIDALSIEYNEAMPWLSRINVQPDRLVIIEAMKSFNFYKVIASSRLQLHHHRSKKIVNDIFEALAKDEDGKLLSEYHRHQLSLCKTDKQKRMRLVADIISSFTDLEAIRFYDQLTSSRNAPFMGYSR